ncbi:hypothetical protein ALC53_09538 [Atta colombica]|uniref:Uncharacterized protein n=1 Tax=Atta colombica TaxID=520822 RepID=A0A195B6X4_9HYME|nr:hypothetical protein ALC53_09538 [Atta colombica]
MDPKEKKKKTADQKGGMAGEREDSPQESSGPGNFTGITTLERFCNSLSPSRRAITFSSRKFRIAFEREEKWDEWIENVIILMNI